MLGNYLKLSLKVLMRRKFFTAVSLFGISFTLVVLTVVVAMLDYMIAPMPPETRAERTLVLYQIQVFGADGRRGRGEMGYYLVDRYLRDVPGVERVSLVSSKREVSAYARGTPVICTVRRTDADYWKILDFAFLEGGPFTAEDVRNESLVAVISEATRQRFFGDEPALGMTVEADGLKFRVVGVVPNVSRLRPIAFGDIWVPHTTEKADGYRTSLRASGYWGVFLAHRRADFPMIRDEMRSRLRAIPVAAETEGRFDRIAAYPETPTETVGRVYGMIDNPAAGGGGEGAPNLRRFFGVMAGLAFLFMLLPTVNLVNLNVSRILERASEIGVRKAFGATRRTLIGQFVVENVVLTIVGGVLGLVMAAGVLALITRSGIIPYAQFRLNVRVVMWGLAIACVFGLISGVYPAWRMSRLNPVDALKGGGR
jgi:putative ABC transport system permease protein